MKFLSTLIIGLAFWLINPNQIIAQQIPMNFPEFSEILMLNSDGRKDKTGGGNSPSGNNNGGGASGINITLNLADDNVIMPKAYTINWSDTNMPVTVIVGEDALLNGAIAYQAKVKANSIQIPFGKLDLDSTKKYYVQIKSDSGKSKKAMFRLTSKKAMSSTISELKKSADYKAADSFKQTLMTAYALELNKLNLDAAKLYMKYMADDEEDMILRNMKDRFEERTGI